MHDWRVSMLKIPDFTRPEIEYIKENANFTEQENSLFDLRNRENSLENCAEEMNISLSTVKRINKRIKSKIIRIL